MEDADLISKAKTRYQQSIAGWSEIYKQASDDMAFVYDVGDGQWPAKMRKDRERDRRPVITVNKLQKFVRTLRGDALQNRPRMKVIPVDNKGDVEKAGLYNDLIRQIEYLSDAPTAYDTGYAQAISSSIGFFRIITEFADDDSFDQNIRIKRIINPMSVHYDFSATEFEYEDAKYCFVEDTFDVEDFKRRWPNADHAHFEGTGAEKFGCWLHGDQVKVAEYFYKEPVQKTIVQLSDGTIVDLSKTITEEFLKSKGGHIVNKRIVNTHKVLWVKMNGVEVLERGEWPGKHIPIIPVLGDEIVVDGEKHYLSFLRGAKGSQEMYNYWSTAATETVALAPKMPYIIDHRQIKGFENEWDDANRTNRMYIRYNAIQGLQKPTRERGADIPASILSMMQSTAMDIEDHLGRYESSKGEASNERSKVAIVARIQQSDKGTYAFVDNFKKAIMYATRQMIDLIPKVYDTQRALRVMDETGKERIVDVNVPGVDEEEPIVKNDLSVGKYDLVATVGASFTSKREEMTETMMQAMQYAPGLANVLLPLLFKFSDMEGSQEVAKKLEEATMQMQQQEQAQGDKQPQV